MINQRSISKHELNNYQKKEEIQELINQLKPNMFTLKNINYFCKHNQILSENKINKKYNNIYTKKDNLSNNVSSTLYKIIQKDSLFWCFYVLKNGIIEYERNMLNSCYILEKTEKLSYINIIRENKDLLKSNKIKLICEIEDDLANNEIISLKTFFVLCIIEKINIIFIDGRKYYEVVNNENIINTTNIIYKNNDINEYYIDFNIDINSNKVSFYKNNYLHINNYDNKLKPISSYKLDELLDICKRLNIDINNNGKRKTKKEIYECILLNFR